MVKAQLDGTPSAKHTAALRVAAECIAAKAAEHIAAECVAAAHSTAECIAAECVAAACGVAKCVAAECVAAVRGAAKLVAAERAAAKCEHSTAKCERSAAKHYAAECGAGLTTQLLSGRTPVTVSKAAPKKAHAEAKWLKNEGKKAHMARRWAEAVTEYRRAIELWPLYAMKLRMALKHATAEDVYAEVKQLKNEGKKARMARQWAEAAAEYRRVIELWPLYAMKLWAALEHITAECGTGTRVHSAAEHGAGKPGHQPMVCYCNLPTCLWVVYKGDPADIS